MTTKINPGNALVFRIFNLPACSEACTKAHAHGRPI
jgi:hypothetical protein